MKKFMCFGLFGIVNNKSFKIEYIIKVKVCLVYGFEDFSLCLVYVGIF